MPQEAGTVRLLSQKGAGILLEKPKDIVSLVRSLSTDSVRYSALRNATAGMSIPNSTESIVREILDIIPAEKVTPASA